MSTSSEKRRPTVLPTALLSFSIFKMTLESSGRSMQSFTRHAIIVSALHDKQKGVR
jgi:hypothetical protein